MLSLRPTALLSALPHVRAAAPHARSVSASAASAASASRESTAATTAAAAPATKAKPASLRVTHPRTVFRSQMKTLRRQYQLELAELSAKRASDHSAEDSAQDELVRRAKDIEAFRKQRAAYLKGIDAFIAPMNVPTPVDAVLKSSPSSSSSSSSQSVFTSKRQSLRGDASNADQGNPLDAVFEERKALWRSYIDTRRARRFQNLATFRSTESETRMDSLTYLFHSAANFVTYSNMEEKLETAVRVSGSVNNPSINELLASANQQELSGESSYSASTYGQVSPSPIGMRSALGSPSAKDRRELALKNALLGTTNNDQLDARAIREKHEARARMMADADGHIPDSELPSFAKKPAQA
ncbi:hypothetical protein BC831DRAFT_447258 [Entophlyctis helioformis]|nr:hypothetical protein BC831DRAFT_447258 [Entophlyctis helioformis]